MRVVLSRVHWIVAGLVLASMSIYGLRLFVASNEPEASGVSLWQVRLNATITQAVPDSQIYISIPSDDTHIRVAGQSFRFPDFRVKRIKQSSDGTRQVVIAPVTAKTKAVFTSEFDLQLSAENLNQSWLEGKTLAVEDLEKYLDRPSDSKNTLLFDKINQFRQDTSSSEQIAKNIFDFVHKNIHYDPGSSVKTELKILETKRGDEMGKARLMILFARHAAIPARLVSGIIIKEQFDLEQHYWVELYLNDGWHAFDPTLGFADNLPENYLRLSYDNPILAYLADGSPVDVVIDAIKLVESSHQGLQHSKTFSDSLDITRLPQGIQFLILCFLFLPLGALLAIVFRSFIGVRIYGSLTPALMAISIMQSNWYTIFVVAAILTGVGLASETVVRQTISKVARLSIIVTVAAVVIAIGILIMEYAGLSPSAKVVLLPFIVLSFLVDRLYSTQYSKGWFIALYRLIWTVVVMLCCLLLFSIPGLEYSILNYPELLLLVLAVMILLGRYSGEQLVNRDRFDWIKEPKEKPDPLEQDDSVEDDDIEYNLTSLD